MILRLEHPLIALFLVCLLLIVAWWRWYYHKNSLYYYPLAFLPAQAAQAPFFKSRHVLFALRTAALILLALITARIQYADEQYKVPVQGIDIMVALDVSGSMQMESRLETAKEQAIRFIQNRPHDAIGLVIFGAIALCSAPLTPDKQLIETLIAEIYPGMIPYDGTVICTALATAAARLRSSPGKTKIVILLTDGSPSSNDTCYPQAMALIKHLGIKVYTVGIGSEEPIICQDPVSRQLFQVEPVNKRLLQTIAYETGGQFFLARHPEELATIYTTINALEKTSQLTPIFSHYQDLYMPILMLILLVLLSESMFILFLRKRLW